MVTGEMSGFVGVIVSDPWLQSQLTQVELRSLNSKVSPLFHFFFFSSRCNLEEARLIRIYKLLEFVLVSVVEESER